MSATNSPVEEQQLSDNSLTSSEDAADSLTKSMESLKKINFACLLEKGAETGWEKSLGDLTHDVEFVFLGGGKEENKGGAGEIKAHKLLLSVASQVFRAQFFGAMAAHSEENPAITQVFVKDATPAAFDIMIRFTYSNDESLVTSLTDLDLLFQVAVLADKYFFTDLWRLAEATIEAMPVSVKTYASVLRLVADYEKLLPFQSLCKSVEERCVLTVAAKWNAVSDCVKFWLTHHDDDPTFKLRLMEKMDHVCFSCSPPKMKHSCPKGKKLTEDNARLGLGVKYTIPLPTAAGTIIKANTSGIIEKLYKPGEQMDRGNNPVRMTVKFNDPARTTQNFATFADFIMSKHSIN